MPRMKQLRNREPTKKQCGRKILMGMLNAQNRDAVLTSQPYYNQTQILQGIEKSEI